MYGIKCEAQRRGQDFEGLNNFKEVIIVKHILLNRTKPRNLTVKERVS